MPVFRPMALAAAVLALATAAQGANAMDMMKMSKADMAAMKRCQAMSHQAMMKSKRCAAVMKAHPDAMSSGAMTSDHPMSGGAMSNK